MSERERDTRIDLLQGGLNIDPQVDVDTHIDEVQIMRYATIYERHNYLRERHLVYLYSPINFPMEFILMVVSKLYGSLCL